MRYLAVPEGDRKQLDADPEWAESFLGAEPELSRGDVPVWATYWTARQSNPRDAMGGPCSLDLVRAIDLYERLHGETSARALAEKFQAMDAVYLNDLAERQARKKKEGID